MPAANANSPKMTIVHHTVPSASPRNPSMIAAMPSMIENMPNRNTSAASVMPGQIIAQIPKAIAANPRTISTHQRLQTVVSIGPSLLN